jgi:hypothetical protein
VTVTVADTGGKTSTDTKQVVVSNNLVGNAGFEVNTSGWSSGGVAAVILARVSGGHSGGWAAKLTNTAKNAKDVTLDDTPNWVTTTAASMYTASMWVRADTSGASLKLRWREFVGTTQVAAKNTTISLTTSWQLITVAYRPASAGTSNLDLNAFIAKAPSGTGFYADDVSITRT